MYIQRSSCIYIKYDVTFPLAFRNRDSSTIPLVSRVAPSMIRSRNFATEEAKENAEQPDLSPKEKELTHEIEKLTKDVETITEKNKELDVRMW